MTGELIDEMAESMYCSTPTHFNVRYQDLSDNIFPIKKSPSTAFCLSIIK